MSDFEISYLLFIMRAMELQSDGTAACYCALHHRQALGTSDLQQLHQFSMLVDP